MRFNKRDWAGTVALRAEGKYLTNQLVVDYRPYDLVNGIPRVGIGRSRDGGTLPADRWLKDKWAASVIEEAEAGWFSSYLERMAKGEQVPMWQVSRDYENRKGVPMPVTLTPFPPWLTFEIYCCR